MADSGPYLANLDELVRFANRQIPPGEPLLVLPGEDPFYFATGRTPQFPILLMDPATDPYGPRELLAEAERRRVRWVIVKRVLQVRQSPMPEAEETLRLVEQKYPLCKRLAGYDVYCTKQGTGT